MADMADDGAAGVPPRPAAETNKQKTFLSSGNVWVLIPLLALLIPILAVAGAESPIGIALAAIGVIVALAVAGGFLMTHRHNLRIVEIEAQERSARADTEQLEQTNRLLRQNAELTELRAALRVSEAAKGAAVSPPQLND